MRHLLILSNLGECGIEYHRLKKQAESDLEQKYESLFLGESFERIGRETKENVMLYKQAAEVVMTMLKQH